MTQKIKFDRKAVFFLVVAGLIAGYAIIPFVHEAGHYTIACVSNCSAIKEFVYAPQFNLLPSNYSGYEVRYTDPVKTVYGSYGIAVYLGGFLFEIALFVAIILLLRKRANAKPTKVSLFLLGFFMIFINSSFTWIADFASFMAFYFNSDFLTIQLVVYSLMIVIYSIWFVCLVRFVRIIDNALPRKRRRQQKK
ncbi:MAG TPA: hypothetical protein VJB05_01730 [archaeon]|nr:hypothetical protein [archaeon]